MTTYRKKLIEVALPLEAISDGCHAEKNPFLKGHPRSMHLWWARRPLAAARAVIFSQMVDDPSEYLADETAIENERKRLFELIEELVKWENTNNEKLLEKARAEIRRSWSRHCLGNESVANLTDSQILDKLEKGEIEKLPGFHDPFAGGGALPLEAQRLALEAHASDLNPVAVLINKAMIEIPSTFTNMPPVNPQSREENPLMVRKWAGAEGLIADVKYYGKWMRDEAEKRIGNCFPKVEVTKEMASDRKDLVPYVGRKLKVIAWLWARTVKSPNPSYASVDVPLVSTFILSSRQGREAYIETEAQGASYQFRVRAGKPIDIDAAAKGTKLAHGANFRCVVSGAPICIRYIRSEAQAGRMNVRLMAIVAEGDRTRVYLPPTSIQESTASEANPKWKPDLLVPSPCHDVDRLPMYGMATWGDAFSPRQLLALTTFSDLAQEVRVKVMAHIQASKQDGRMMSKEWSAAYADAVSTYLACGISQMSRYACTICAWNKANENIAQAFGRHAIQMVWDYAESNPLVGSLAIDVCVGWVASAIQRSGVRGTAQQADAQIQSLTKGKVVSTDPPYYDNIGYAELSDFFYVWLRRSLKAVYPELFATVAVPKTEELVATPYRHGGKANAEAFFMDGMTHAMNRLAEQAHSAFPVTIYYAFKQSESKRGAGTASTGWETFLAAVIKAGFAVTGTWPLRTERTVGLKGTVNALASSIILVCRRRMANTGMTTRRDFQAHLRRELPEALRHLQQGNIAPVDLAQSSIGPGMAIFSSYSKVVEADGSPMKVRTALALINEALDEVLAEQEGDLDAETRWAIAWYSEYGTGEGPFGRADDLSRAKNTSVDGLHRAGIVLAKSGKVNLLRRTELDTASTGDSRLANTKPIIWSVTQQLIRALENDGESAAANLLAHHRAVSEQARDLAYRLYNTCERKGWAEDARSYNGLVMAWPELVRMAAAIPVHGPEQQAELVF